ILLFNIYHFSLQFTFMLRTGSLIFVFKVLEMALLSLTYFNNVWTKINSQGGFVSLLTDLICQYTG
ncbi:hypothetical protein ACJX0J_034298, partial [Zea mays]